MKKISFILLFAFSLALQAQLPPTAQALYNEMYNKDTLRAKYCLTNGAQAFATADGKSFYLKWFPAAATPSTTPLLVTMHGSDGNAFNEFFFVALKSSCKRSWNNCNTMVQRGSSS